MRVLSDLRSIVGGMSTPVSVLAKACDQLCECKSFSSMGFLKFVTGPMAPFNDGRCMYVRDDPLNNCELVPRQGLGFRV